MFGDWPYNQNLLANAPLLTQSVHADPAVSQALHVGDIRSGSMPCTSAGILPPLATSDPGRNRKVYHQFQPFAAPLVCTPGDNEWTDCHESKEKSSGAPLQELASVRSLFFAKPGRSLGGVGKPLTSQAQLLDPAHPADAQFVENVLWEDSHVVFVTLNMPGSNNDTLPWTGNVIDPAAQAKEVAERTDADIRWLQAAFARAQARHAKAIVIGLQADIGARLPWPPALTTCMRTRPSCASWRS